MEDYLAVSALQHYAYCPRQFALIHVEQAWEENRYTAEGQLLHQRVDAGDPEQRKGVRFERGVSLMSERLGLIGKMDLLEVKTTDPPEYFPVEYKRGKPKIEEWDRAQLCAQALCLEEMRQSVVEHGAIWYWEVRRREPVIFDETLREVTLAAVDGAREILATGHTPSPAVPKQRCRACSLKEICQPEAFRNDRTAEYIAEIGT